MSSIFIYIIEFKPILKCWCVHKYYTVHKHVLFLCCHIMSYISCMPRNLYIVDKTVKALVSFECWLMLAQLFFLSL